MWWGKYIPVAGFWGAYYALPLLLHLATASLVLLVVFMAKRSEARQKMLCVEMSGSVGCLRLVVVGQLVSWRKGREGVLEIEAKDEG